MSALRLSTPDCGVRLVDLGPAFGRGHVHVGGHRCVPAPEPEATPGVLRRRERNAANAREYRRRLRELRS